jgi:hypothetical protein
MALKILAIEEFFGGSGQAVPTAKATASTPSEMDVRFEQHLQDDLNLQQCLPELPC